MSTRKGTVAALRAALWACSLGFAALLLQGCNSGADTQPNQPQPPPGADSTPPTAPSSLSATAADSNRIDLTWSASSDAVGVAGYRVYRDGASTALATVTETRYSDTSVEPETTYSYVVRAFDATENLSEASNTASATTPAAPEPQIPGLDTRPSNATCTAWPRPTAGASIALSNYTSLTFSSPIAMLQAPNDDSRWFVVQQNGLVLQFSADNPTSAETFVDIRSRVVSGGETGLLGLAFHPEFPDDPRVFLSYTSGNPLVSRISVFTTSDSGQTADPDPEQVLLTIDQPEDNHNGGHIAFGPEGYLYIGMGDGGGGGDAHGQTGNGQRLTTLLGKMLRIDVDGEAPYGIPPSNPFAGNARCPSGGRASGACPEIYAYGFRNPWRWSFDRTSGELWVADVGQGSFEEVNKVVLGGNYGWRCREGAHDFAMDTPGCEGSALIDPVTEYGRSLGRSITGGYVYRGTQDTTLAGHYVFGDFASGRIFAWVPESPDAPAPTQLIDSDLSISSFGQGNDGELYVVNYGGTLHRIVFESPPNADTVPETLSATGCVSEADPSQPASGLIPYTVNAPFWSDGAQKERWLAVPDENTIAIRTDADWDLPIGSVLMKHFRLGSQLIETRLLMRHPDGSWGGFTYEWNAAQTDATLVRGGARRDLGSGTTWIFPSESECLDCHTSVAGRTLGLETAQLNGDHTYPSTARVANQLSTLTHIGMLAPPIGNPAAHPALPDPADENASLDGRARAYLHTNCSFCHRPGGTTPSRMDLRYDTPLAETNACGTEPQSGDLGLGDDARLIAPSDPTNSVLLARMNRRDEYAMPPLGSNRIDTEGVALITQWIESLETCSQ